MFTCSSCKKFYSENELSHINPTGKYCKDCNTKRLSKAVNARLNNRKTNCSWCGEPLSNSKLDNASSEYSSVHASCANNRDWLLKCIRYSDKPFKYITKKEAENKPIREERKKIEEIEEKSINFENQINIKKEEKIENLEKMVFYLYESVQKLTNSLGGL
jgi:hypothetical protein